MGKDKVKYVCTECGYEAARWLGKCPGCESWNSMEEEIVPGGRNKGKEPTGHLRAIPLSAITSEEAARFSSGLGELDRVLGGGIVPGSLVLLGGDPGIGKSTLLLQTAGNLARGGERVIYLSGEESLHQIKMRSSRLGINSNRIFLVNEQNLDYLSKLVEELEPRVIIVDSIQTVYTGQVSSIPGTVTQLRECTARLMELAKKDERTVFLAGHVTKEGAIAGPRVLEHMVDTVIYFEGDQEHTYRILRSIKNRFGSTNEIGLLEMSGQGLREVGNPSLVFLAGRNQKNSGSAVVASFEGSRPLLVEVQALVAPSGYSYPRRMVSGLDQNRLALIVAVLEKRCGVGLSNCDVYIKIAGGVFVRDPSADLGIATAIISSFRDTPVQPDTIFVGEVGLSGEIRATTVMEARLREAVNLGFSRAVIPANSTRKGLTGIDLVEVHTIDEVLEFIQ